MHKDGLYTKYRVFREPDVETQEGHPVEVIAYCFVNGPDEGTSIEEVDDGMLFVLRPANDRHAQVALAAYAESCRDEMPQLSADVLDMLGDSR